MVQSPETERKMLEEWTSSQKRGASSQELDAIFQQYPRDDAMIWVVELKLHTLLPDDHEEGKMTLANRVMLQWRNFSHHKKSMEVVDQGLIAVFFKEDGARNFAYHVAGILKSGFLKRGLYQVKTTTKPKVSGDNSAVAKAFTGWLTERMKGEPGELWSPAPKAGGSWVYGTTVAKFNEETGSSLAFMALCASLERKPQVKDGKKRVLILTTEVS
jgi:hypothetical protein